MNEAVRVIGRHARRPGQARRPSVDGGRRQGQMLAGAQRRDDHFCEADATETLNAKGGQMANTGTYIAKKRELSVQAILEWAFRNEGVRLELPEDFEQSLGRSFGRGTWARFEQLEALGCHIDGGGRSEAHEDAETVAAIVSNLSDLAGGKFMAVQVASHAKAGSTPNWMPGAKCRIVPVAIKGDGQAATEVCGHETISYRKTDKNGRSRKRTKREEVRWCPVIESPSRHQVERARGFYAEWWLALSEIRRMLQASQMLRRHIVTESMPPKTPWAKEPPAFTEIEGLRSWGWV